MYAFHATADSNFSTGVSPLMAGAALWRSQSSPRVNAPSAAKFLHFCVTDWGSFSVYVLNGVQIYERHRLSSMYLPTPKLLARAQKVEVFSDLWREDRKA